MYTKQRISNRVRKGLFILCFLLGALIILAPFVCKRKNTPAATPPPPTGVSYDRPTISPELKQEINHRIRRLINDYKLKRDHIGMKIIAFPSGEVVYENDSEFLMLPASNLKLITTGVALCKLGPDFLFTTSLYQDGAVKDGILDGNLVVKSNGDPNISGRFYNDNPTAVFEQWAEKLARLGVREIRGDLIMDDTAFDREHIVDSWPKDQLNCWYCAPVSAISFNDNCIDITVSSPPPKVSASPTTRFVNITNDIYTGASNTLAFLKDRDSNHIRVKGSVSKRASGYKESVPIEQPALYFGTVLAETIDARGIKLTGQCILAERTRDIKAEKLIEIASVSTDLKTTIAVTNQRSQNFYAEQILKLLGYQFKGKGTFDNGIAVVSEFLTKEVGIPDGEFMMADGSGLSRNNWFSAGQFTKFLAYMTGHKYFREYLGTLNNRGWPSPGSNNNHPAKWMDPAQAGSNIWAKTGSLVNVKSLSGYIIGDDSNRPKFIFAIITNGLEDIKEGTGKARDFQNEVAKLLAEIR